MSAPRKVLIVEDSPVQRGIIEDVVLDLAPGAQVVPVETPQQGLNRLAGGLDPDLVLVDFNMPGMNGILFLQEARKRGFRGKVFLVSTEKSTELKEAALAAGASGWLDKPFTIEQFKTVIIEAGEAS